jgi:hypothetical protein
MIETPHLRTALWFVLAAVSMTARLTAQDMPDFSGHWVLKSGSQTTADVPQTLSVKQPLVRTNVRGEPMKPFFRDITVARGLQNGTRSETYQIGVEGGLISGRADGGVDAQRRHHRVVWEEQTLVIENSSYTGPTPESGEWTARREVWSLDPGGQLRLRITTRSSVDPARTVTLVYRRQ